jgi:transposase
LNSSLGKKPVLRIDKPQAHLKQYIMSKVIGIDVSKKTLDVCLIDHQEKSKHIQVSNCKKGFREILSYVEKVTKIVMEASGPYYLQLAIYLNENQAKVYVVNPLVIKRYSQMLLNRAKTDKKDAQVIANYALIHSPKRWLPQTNVTNELKQLYTALELINKQSHQTSMQLEAFESSGILSKSLGKELRAITKHLKLKKCKLEGMITELAESAYKETLVRLQSIPGIGKKTAIFLIALTDDFKKFNHHKQLIAYVGLSPRLYQSGTSVKGKGHICKMGQPQIRKLLYLCSWTAKKCNKTCIEMYERLKAKGKPERVIKIAIANKLLKQAFAIAKGNKFYNENYSINPCF